MAHAIAYDYNSIEAYCRACAKIICMSQSVRVRWVADRDSMVLNALYMIAQASPIAKSGPGRVEVDVKTARELTTEIEEMTSKFVITWLKTCVKDPKKSEEFIQTIGEQRAKAFRNMQGTLTEVAKQNAQIAETLGRAAKHAAMVKLGGTVGVAVIGASAGILIAGGAAAVSAGGVSMGLGGGGLAFMGVSVGSSMTMSVAKNFSSGGSASAVAIDMGKTMGKTAGSEGLGYYLKKVEILGVKLVEESPSIARQNALLEIKRYSNLLGRKGVTPRQIARYTRNKAAAEATLKTASQSTMINAAKFTGKAVPCIFAAWDIYDGIKEYQNDVKGL